MACSLCPQCAGPAPAECLNGSNPHFECPAPCFCNTAVNTTAKVIDHEKSYKMEMMPRRLGIKLNDKSMYYDSDAELNYKKKRHTL